MEVISITVENYRSITAAKRIPFDRYTLLIGPNNEGKSNILKALSLAMTTLQRWRPRTVRTAEGKLLVMPPDRSYRRYDADYNWQNDFPLRLQNKKTTKNSEITVEFSLNDSEVYEFSEEIGSNLNGTLPIKFSFSRDEFDISIAKPGRGHVTLNKKTTRIASFVSRRFKFEYIPAIRTAGSAEEVVRALVSNELKSIEDNQKYQQAIKTINEIQQPVLDRLSESVTKTVSSFLPSVERIELKVSRSSRANVLRRTIEIDVDDGVKTGLDQKGDGVQSLVALALMRHASDYQAGKQNLLIAIEEPESHLHPRAVRDLRDVILKLARNSQVVVSSHSPLLVRWEGSTSTIIVESNKASMADKIALVRQSLGVMVSDNLSSVEFVIFVEGMSDKKILRHIINHNGSSRLRELFSSGRVAIQSIGGAGKLIYHINSADHNILGSYVFLDNDNAARTVVERAIKQKIITETGYTLCACPGMPDSEIEDIVRPDVYRDEFIKRFDVDVSSAHFRGNRKWSIRMREGFHQSGKLWEDEKIDFIKTALADAFCKAKVEEALIPQKRASVDKLMEKLEKIDLSA